MLADIGRSVDAVCSLDYAAARTNSSAPRAILLTGATGWIGAHVLGELLARTAATIHCLVRDGGHARVVDAMAAQEKRAA